MFRTTVLSTLLLAATAAGCSSSDSDSPASPDPTPDAGPPDVFPDSEWATGSLEEGRLDAAALNTAIEFAGSEGSNCLVITRDGVLLSETYWNDWDSSTEGPVFSVTKSFASTVVGIAADKNLIDINDPASMYIDEWAGTDSQSITIRNLLSNDSGREWDFVVDYVDMFLTAPDKTQFSIDLGQQHSPGQHWEYNNSAIQTLERVLEVATGTDVADFAQENLLDPIGMASDVDRDDAGNPLLFTGLNASCRDLARLGLLMLRKGRWANDVQIVSEDWVEEATTTSTPINTAYGYLWWLNREGRWVLPSAPDRSEGDGQIIPGARSNAFAAVGLGSQVILVDPDTGIVFTRIGDAGSGSLAVNALMRELTTRVMAAVIE